MRIARVLRLLGELLITAGVVVALFAVWQLVWTDVVADRDAVQVVTGLTQEFTQADADDDAIPVTPTSGAYAVVRIPRFGADYARPLYEGTTREALNRGIGHYSGTQQAGEIGNFAIAAHRTTYGKAFAQIAELVPGDAVVIETRERYFVYRVTGHEVVAPDHLSVLLPVPDRPGAKPSTAVLTMTSCHPEFSSRERFVVHAELAASYRHRQGLPAEWTVTG